MNLLHFWRVFHRWWWLPVTAALVMGGAGYLVSRRTPPIYQASTRVLVSSAQPGGPTSYDDTLASANLAKTYSEFAHDPFILRQTSDRLRLRLTPSQLDQKIDAQIVRDTPLLEIMARDGSPTRAAAIADTLAQALVAYATHLQTQSVGVAQQQTAGQIATLRQALAAATAQLDRLRPIPFPDVATTARVRQLQIDVTGYQNKINGLVDAQRQLTLGQAQTAPPLTALGPASVPTTPVQPQPLRTLVLAGIIGFLLAFGAALLLDLVDDRVRDPADIENLLGASPLAVVGFVRDRSPQSLPGWPSSTARATTLLAPRGRSSGVRLLSGSTVAKGARFTEDLLLLRAGLDAVMIGRPTAFCVSSAGPGEGKSTIAANLALLEAQAGKRVILVDANLRDPQLHQYFDVANDYGLSAYLAPKPVGTQPPLQDGPLNIKILVAGAIPPDPAELLGSQRMGELLHMLRARADVVIVDTAPILDTPDTALLQRLVDGTVLVVDMRQARGKAIEAALSSLQRASGTVLGVVLNKSDRRTPRRHRRGLITATQDTLLLRPPATIGEGAANALRNVQL